MADEYLRNLPVPFFSQRQNDYILNTYYEQDVKDDATGCKIRISNVCLHCICSYKNKVFDIQSFLC